MSHVEGVTLVIPTIPPRTRLLARALKSVAAQRVKFSDVHLSYDLRRQGAAATRQRGVDAVSTRWVAFLDDDDELYPIHLETLIHAALDTRADLVFPWFDVAGGTDPFPMHFGRDFDPAAPHMFPITVLCRVEALRATGGFRVTDDDMEDWNMWRDLARTGAVIRHVPIRTWLWHHDTPGGNTSGRPDRW